MLLLILVVLVRGLDIEKEEYPLGVLIDHAGALLDVDYTKKDEPPEILLQRKLGLKDSDVNDSLPLRKQIKEIFLDNRSLSLKYLTEGLTLDGKYPPKVFSALCSNTHAKRNIRSTLYDSCYR